MSTLSMVNGRLAINISGSAAIEADMEFQKRKKKFSDLCTKLKENVHEEKNISEHRLEEFSKMFLWIIRNNVQPLPESFSEMYVLLSNYWRYGIRKDENFERKCSYIRLYQMANLLKSFGIELKQESKVVSMVMQDRVDSSLVRGIRSVPGITHKKLEVSLGMSSEELTQKMLFMEQQGFVLGRNSGENRGYILTSTGENLYQCLNEKRRYHEWMTEWSKERILLFLMLFGSHLPKKGFNSLKAIETLSDIVEYREDDIKKVFFRQNENVVIAEEYKNRDVMQKIEFLFERAEDPLSEELERFKKNKHEQELKNINVSILQNL